MARTFRAIFFERRHLGAIAASMVVLTWSASMKSRSPLLLAAARAAALASLVGAGSAGCSDSAEPDPPDPPVVCEAAAAVRDQLAASGSNRSQCGPALEFTEINAYQGELASAQDREEAVILLGGACTGTLIAAAKGPVVITAGHCFTSVGATVLAAFNVEADADGEQLVTEATVIERSTAPDYALVQLQMLPQQVVPTLLTSLPSERLAIIQHPRGRPKVIAEGDYLDACNQLVYYVDLDTLVGSSGAGVLNQQGHLLGIHTDGTCDDRGGGANLGWTAAAIVDASAWLESGDLAER
jgi:Trypsin-like peptidase domain